MSLSPRAKAVAPDTIEMIEPAPSSVTGAGPKSATAKIQQKQSRKRPSLDNFRLRSLRKEGKTWNNPETPDPGSEEARQWSTGTSGQPQGHRNREGRQSSQPVMTGPIDEKQRQQWYQDENLKLRLRVNGLVSGSGLGQMRAGYPCQQAQPPQSKARAVSRS